MNTRRMISVSRIHIPKNASRYLQECVSSGWFSAEGSFTKRFEERFAEYLSVPYSSTTSSGTAALHLALLALGVGKGDEVILPAMTIASCYFAVWYTGATAVPVDVDPDIYTIDPSLIEAKISKKTKVIMVVHLFGHPCDMDPIITLANKYGIKILEDAAEAHGAEYKGKKVGSLGDIGIFSFYANKIVTTGEGGMVVSRHKQYIDKVNKLKSLNHTATRFIHNGIGYNYLMSNMQAALGLASLEEIERSIRNKRSMAAYYHARLSHLPGLILPTEKPWAKSVYWMYAVRIAPSRRIRSRERLTANLTKAGIQTRTFFYSPRTAFAKLNIYNNTYFPVAEKLEQTGLYLPSGLGNVKSELKTVSDSLIKILL
jgi:perosamine synthetase